MLPLEDIFDLIKDLPKQQQKNKLSEFFPGDPDKQLEILSLVNLADEASGFLSGPVGFPMEQFSPPPDVQSFTIGDLIGTGGSGNVYAAYKRQGYEHKVAIKFFNHMPASERARFFTERQLLAKLSHPYITKLIDSGICPQTAQPYLIMEFVEGLDIQRYCEEHRYSIEQRLLLFIKVCEAIQYLHNMGVIHRDLKPSNILIDHLTDPKVIDFGIAKTDGLVTGQKTRTGHYVCTPEYASPEQINQGPITPTSDIYSLGVILYELICGKRPHDFSNKGIGGIIRALSTEKILPPSRVATKCMVPKRKAALDQIVMHCLNLEPDKRYHHPSELADDIKHFLQNKPLLNKCRYHYRFTGRLILAVMAFALVLYWHTAIIDLMSGPQALNSREPTGHGSMKTLDIPPPPKPNDRQVTRLSNKPITEKKTKQKGSTPRHEPPTAQIKEKITTKKTPGRSSAYYLELSTQLGAQGKFRQAIAAAQTCREISTQLPALRKPTVIKWKCRIAQAHWYIIQGQAKKGLDILHKLRLSMMASGYRPPRFLRVRLLEEEGEAMAQLGRLDEALRVQNQAMRIARRIRFKSSIRFYALHALARRHKDLGDDETAKELLLQTRDRWQRELEEFPRNPQAHQALAAIYSELTLLYPPRSKAACPWYHSTVEHMKYLPRAAGLAAYRFRLPETTEFQSRYAYCREKQHPVTSS